MNTEQLIIELKKKSKELFDKKQFIDSGRINMAINVLEYELELINKKK